MAMKGRTKKFPAIKRKMKGNSHHEQKGTGSKMPVPLPML